MCSAVSLVDGVSPSINNIYSTASLVLGLDGTRSVTGTDDAMGVGFTRDLASLYQHASYTGSALSASIQGRNYLSQYVTAQPSLPASVKMVLRTPTVWVDRQQFRLAFMLFDAKGSQAVSTSSVSVSYAITLSGAGSITGTCTASQGVAYCARSSLTSTWFENAYAGTADVDLTLSIGGVPVSSASLPGSLLFTQQPAWYDTGLRTASTGNGLSIPSDHGLVDGGVFITLPVMDMYAAESFDVYLYANTNSFVLSSLTVQLFYDATLLECTTSCSSSYSQNSDFNTAAFLSTTGQLSFSITGVRDTASNSDTTGTAIFLFKVQLKFKLAVAAGTYDASMLNLYPRAETLANTGGHAFVSTTTGTQHGTVFDHRDNANTFGQMTVQAPVDRGIFAYTSEPVLLNKARLGASASYTPVVYKVTSDSRQWSAAASVVTPSSCALTNAQTVSSVVSVSGSCLLVMTQAQVESATGVSLEVAYVSTATFATSIVFDVFSPGPIAISAPDTTLNVIQNAAGVTLSGCTASSVTRYPYQSTRIKATATTALPQGVFTLDLTHIVTFSVDSASVVAVGSGTTWNLLSGKSAGGATVYLGTHNAETQPTPPSLSVTVSDTPVHVVSMVSRLVTHVTWESQPSLMYVFGTNISAGVMVSQHLLAEGDTGLLYSTVAWSDGASGDVGYDALDGLDEVKAMSGTSNVVMHEPQSFGNSDSFWKMGVAVAASRECVSSVNVNWTVCGSTMAVANVPMFLDLPDAVSTSLQAIESRLTGPDDDARHVPINVSTATSLEVVVAFSDGTTRDMTSDSRVTYSTTSSACGVADNVDDTVMTVSGARAAGCSEVVVLATVVLGTTTLTANHTVPLIYLDRIAVDFVGYPAHNSFVTVTKLYQLECQSGVYQHAAPRVTAHLTDQQEVTVTNQSSLQSANTAVVSVSGTTRLLATHAGSSVVTASFGTVPTITSGTLLVDSTVASATAVAWDVYGATGPESTLMDYVDGLSAAPTDVTFAQMDGQSGALTYNNIGGSAFTSPQWVDITTMVSFSTSNAQAISVDATGTLTMRGNAYTAVGLEAQLSCSTGMSIQKTVKANLNPLELDVDAGEASGFQFQQSSNLLPIKLRVRGITSVAHRAITAFGIRVYGYDTSILSSRSSDGAAFSSSGLYSGTASELDGTYNSVVGGLARVVGADSTSTASGGSVGLEIGTLTLGVVGSGVTLIDVEIENLEIYDTQSAVKATELQYVGAVAAVGYVSVDGQRRRRLAQADARTPPSQLATYPRQSQRRTQTACDPCASLVWGDFNGACNFLPTDVSALQRLVLDRLSFSGGSGADPLETVDWTTYPATGCEDFIQQQANPTRDVMDFGQSDPRYLAVLVDATDTQHLLSASVKNYRLLANLNASCTDSSVPGSANREVRIVARLVGGDGQNAGTVGADPLRTDVFAELRVSPAAADFEVNVGSVVTGRMPAAGFPDSSFSGMGPDQSGSLMQFLHIGSGYYELRMQPQDASNAVEFSYEFALLVETKTAALAQYDPGSFKPWLGSSVLPYTESGFSFKPVWGGGAQLGGGGSSFTEGRVQLTCGVSSPGFLLSPSPPPPPPVAGGGGAGGGSEGVGAPYAPSAPPPVPPPPYLPDQYAVYVVRTTLLFAGSVESFPSAALQTFLQWLAGLHAFEITISVVPASVATAITITTSNQTAARIAMDVLHSWSRDMSVVSVALNVTMIGVQSPPAEEVIIVYSPPSPRMPPLLLLPPLPPPPEVATTGVVDIPPPPSVDAPASPPPPMSTPLIDATTALTAAGGGAGGVGMAAGFGAAVVMIIVCCICYRRRKSAQQKAKEEAAKEEAAPAAKQSELEAVSEATQKASNGRQGSRSRRTSQKPCSLCSRRGSTFKAKEEKFNARRSSITTRFALPSPTTTCGEETQRPHLETCTSEAGMPPSLKTWQHGSTFQRSHKRLDLCDLIDQTSTKNDKSRPESHRVKGAARRGGECGARRAEQIMAALAEHNSHSARPSMLPIPNSLPAPGGWSCARNSFQHRTGAGSVRRGSLLAQDSPSMLPVPDRLPDPKCVYPAPARNSSAGSAGSSVEAALKPVPPLPRESPANLSHVTGRRKRTCARSDSVGSLLAAAAAVAQEELQDNLQDNLRERCGVARQPLGSTCLPVPISSWDREACRRFKEGHCRSFREGHGAGRMARRGGSLLEAAAAHSSGAERRAVPSMPLNALHVCLPNASALPAPTKKWQMALNTCRTQRTMDTQCAVPQPGCSPIRPAHRIGAPPQRGSSPRQMTTPQPSLLHDMKEQPDSIFI